MVILSVITKDILPFASVPIYDVTNVNLRNKDQYMDHERFAVYLETELTSHFMFKEKDFAVRCASTSKVAYAMDEAISSKRSIDPTMLGLLGPNKDSEKTKRFPGYAIYLGYRLKKRMLQQTEPITNLKFGKHLSLIASLKKLQQDPFSTKKVLDTNIIKKSASPNSNQKFAKDKLNQEIHDQPIGETSEDHYTEDELEAWRRRLSNDVTPGRGTGEYIIEDLEDNEYGMKKIIAEDNNKASKNEDRDDEDEGFHPHDEDNADDEKMLEELENKQLMFKLETLQEDYDVLRVRIVELQGGEITIDSRLLALETTVEGLIQ